MKNLNKVIFLGIFALQSLFFGDGIMAADDSSTIVGKWTYRSGSFKDVHHFLEGGKMGNSPEASWKIEGNKLIVKWPNGWTNVYHYPPVLSKRLTGYDIDPDGKRNPISAEKIQDSSNESAEKIQDSSNPSGKAARLIVGKWTYRSGSFKDVHHFLEGGKMGNSPEASWKIEGNKLIVKWPNGWTNVYHYPPVLSKRLTGYDIDPDGKRSPISAEKIS